MNSDRDSEHRRYDRNRDVHSNEDRRENFKRDRGNNIRDNFRRSRSRSPKRSDSRDRKRGRAELQPALREDHYGPALSGVEPSPTVVLKGLPSHTTEPTLNSVLAQFYPKDIRLITQRDGDCKGYAFVEFPSLEYAQYFMTTYAGSAGDRNAAQLIIENRAVLIEYARGDNDRRDSRTERDRDRDRNLGGRTVKLDWLCDTCHCHNFARRDSCFRCSAARTENSVCVASSATGPAHGDAFSDAATNVPSAFLLVRGLSPMTNEEQVNEVFRQFALVKHVSLIRDPAAHYSKGLAFVEFFSPEHAQYALQCTNGLALNTRDMAVSGDTVLQVTFAKESVMHAMLRKAQQPGNVLAVNPLVTTQALQAAQWSANNGYSTASTNHSGSQPPIPSGGPPPTASPASTNALYPPTPALHDPLGLQLYLQQQQGHHYLHQHQQREEVKVAPRWPPHFESNGGQYVYQATSGYFFNAATDFYYDPKSHLYLSARDGVYLQFDAAVQPPFRVFNPPAPTEPIALAHAHTVALTTEPPSHAGSGCVAPNNSTYQAPKPKVRLGLPAAAPTRSGAVGFGFGLSAAKKVKLDLAKWGSLQHEEEEEEEAGGKERGKQAVKSVKKTDCAAVATSDSPGSCLAILEKRTTAGEDVVAGECSRDRSGSMLVALAPTPATPLVTPSAQVSTVPVVAPAAPAAVHTPNLAPICLLCQRQFASFEMLQRHEKESKLHAENLKKLEKG